MAVITLDEGHNVYLHMTKSNNRIEVRDQDGDKMGID